MSNSCSNTNEVFSYFNAIQDGRHFTDFRPNNEIYNEMGNVTGELCNTVENSYDTRICLQRNAQTIIDTTHIGLLNTYNLPRCGVINANNVNSNVVNSNVVNSNTNSNVVNSNSVNNIVNNIKNMNLVNNQPANLNNVVNDNRV
jgi:hypothetical protein